MENKKLILKSSILVFTFIILSKIFGYLFRIIIARFDFEIYGQYNLALSVIDFIIPFLLLGFTVGIVRYVSFYNEKKQTSESNNIISSAFIIALPLSIIFFLLIFFFSDQISMLFNSPELSIFLKPFSILIPLVVLSKIFSSILKANKKPGKAAFAEQFIPNLFRVIILLSLLTIGFKTNAIILAFIIPFSLSLIVSFILSKPLYRFHLGFSPELLKFSWPLIFISLGIGILIQIDTILLGILTNISEVSLYSAAYPTAQLLTIFSISILSLFLPSITERHAKGKSIKKTYKLSMFYLTSTSLLATFLIIILNKPIISLLFGKNYLDASLPLIILATSYFFFNISQPSYEVLLMKKKTKTLLGIYAVAILINIVLNLLLIPFFHSFSGHGMYGASIATLISFTTLSFLTILFSKKSIK